MKNFYKMAHPFNYFLISIFFFNGCMAPQGGEGGGSIISTIIMVVIILLILSMFFKKGSGLRISGPALVIRHFNIDESAENLNVEIVGRAAGITAWLLTVMGLDEETKLSVYKTKIVFKSASLAGELHQVVPLARISSTHCGYSKPIFLLFFGVIFFIAGLISSQVVNGSGLIIVGLIIGGLFVLLYFLSKKISIVLETSGGMQLCLSFKRSVIENVSIDLEQALKVIGIINDNIVKHHQK